MQIVGVLFANHSRMLNVTFSVVFVYIFVFHQSWNVSEVQYFATIAIGNCTIPNRHDV